MGQDRRDTAGACTSAAYSSQDQVRILARTVHVPEGPFLASANTPPEMIDKVRGYLLNVAPQRKLILDPLGYSGFAEPLDPKEYQPFDAICAKLHPPEVLEPADEDSSETLPAEDSTSS